MHKRLHCQTGVIREKLYPPGAKTIMFEQTDEIHLIQPGCFLFLAQNALNVKRCFNFPFHSPHPLHPPITTGLCVCNLPPPLSSSAALPPIISLSHESRLSNAAFSSQIFADLWVSFQEVRLQALAWHQRHWFLTFRARETAWMFGFPITVSRHECSCGPVCLDWMGTWGPDWLLQRWRRRRRGDVRAGQRAASLVSVGWVFSSLLPGASQNQHRSPPPSLISLLLFHNHTFSHSTVQLPFCYFCFISCCWLPPEYVNSTVSTLSSLYSFTEDYMLCCWEDRGENVWVVKSTADLDESPIKLASPSCVTMLAALLVHFGSCTPNNCACTRTFI